MHALGPLLWVIRLALLATVVLHIGFTMLIWKENQAARPQKYAVNAPIKTTIFARTMRLTGLIVLAFIAFHLAHFTLHLINPSYATLHTDLDGQQVHDVYRMVVLGLSSQTLRPVYEATGRIVAWALFAGYAAIPVSVLFFGLGKGVRP